MICCKIITNFDKQGTDFSTLFSELLKKGDVLWEDNYLFFADTSSNTTEKKVCSILKKNGFDKFFISVYDKENQPRESDVVNSWLLDKLVKINYKEYEMASQELFRNVSHGLDAINMEVENMANKKKEGPNSGREQEN